MVRVTQRTFVPSPPAGTDAVELRFRPPSTGPISPGMKSAPPLLVIDVDLIS